MLPLPGCQPLHNVGPDGWGFWLCEAVKEKIEDDPGDVNGDPQNGWMVSFMQNPWQKWMFWGSPMT